METKMRTGSENKTDDDDKDDEDDEKDELWFEKQ